MDINEITGSMVDAAYKLHLSIGPGLLESVYPRTARPRSNGAA
jgi:hypothetical protein